MVGWKKSKLSLFANDMTLCIKTPEESHTQAKRPSKAAEHRNHTQKSVVFLHTHNEQSENEIKKTIQSSNIKKQE